MVYYETKKINYFDTVICIIYIISIGYFLFNKDYKNVGLPTIAFIINLILRWVYSKNFLILDSSLYIVGSLFILFCLVFGSSFRLYDSIKHYDDFLHFWSGFITIKIGFNIIKIVEISNFTNKLLIAWYDRCFIWKYYHDYILYKKNINIQ